MPNWCQNTLTVSGDAGDLLVFAKANIGEFSQSKNDADKPNGLNEAIENAVDLKSLVELLNLHPQPLCMERALPTPEDKLAVSKINGDGWYEWRCNNWGTKWNLSFSEPPIAFVAENTQFTQDHFSVRLEDDKLIYTFDTAWSPPVPYVEFIAHKYSAIRFVLEYAECGMDFAGRMTMHIGQGLEEHIELEVSDVLDEDSFYY